MPQCALYGIKIHVEVPVLLLFFAFILSDSVKTNLIIYRTCYVTLGYNKSECALLGTKNVNNATINLEKIVEPYAAVINMVYVLSIEIFSAFICLFVGPWSDRFGRKPILVIPLVGFALSFLLYSLFAALENISPWYHLLCGIPIYFSGGASSFLTVMFCYITDVTHENNRGMRMGFFEAALSLGIFLGNISSSYVWTATNYPTVFLISSLCCAGAIAFAIFLIPESLPDPESEGRFKNLFNVSNVSDMIKTTFKKRENFDRYTVLSCVVMLTIFITVINGDSAVVYLYLREKFHWTLEKYTLFSALHNITWVFGTVIAIYVIHKLLKIPETIMILVGFISLLNGMIVIAIAKRDIDIYFGAVLRSLGSAVSPMVRSLVSKVVPNEEVGKVFALIVISESMVGLLGSPIYTSIYDATILKNPSTYNFVSCGLYLCEILIIVSIVLIRTFKKTDKPYEELLNKDASASSQESD